MEAPRGQVSCLVPSALEVLHAYRGKYKYTKGTEFKPLWNTPSDRWGQPGLYPFTDRECLVSPSTALSFGKFFLQPRQNQLARCPL